MSKSSSGYSSTYYQKRKSNGGLPLGRNGSGGGSNVYDSESKAIRQKAVNEAQSKFDELASKVVKKQSQLDSMATRINTEAQASDYRKLKSEVESLKAQLKDSEDKLNVAKSTLASDFKSGKPMTDKEINKPLSDDERQVATKALKLDNAPDGTYKNQWQKDSYQADKARYEAAKKTNPDISQAEYKAINKYSREGYVYMNGAPRGLQEDPNSARAREQRVEAKVLQKALDKLPDWKGETIRSSRVPTSQFKGKYKEGSVIRFEGFTSTSSDLSGGVTKNYGKQSKADVIGGKVTKTEQSKASRYEELATKERIKALPIAASTQVEYRMTVKSGKKIDKFSSAPKESEVLLKHGWAGKITKVQTRADGVQVVYITEI